MNAVIANAAGVMRRTAVVTGAVDGLGAEAAVGLAARGYDLVLVNRSVERTRPLLDRLSSEAGAVSVKVMEADLADQDHVVRAARNVLASHPRIDVLVNNAGVLLSGRRFSRHDNELHFQINTLAPYQLMRLLRPALARARGARVVNVSSGAIALAGRLRIDELRRPGRWRKLVGPYAQSKLALTTLTVALAEDFGRDGIVLRSVDPGATRTRMTRGQGMPTPLRLLQPLLFQSASQAAKALLDTSFDARHDGRDGIHLARGKVRKPPADATDPEIQRQLLALCESLTGV